MQTKPLLYGLIGFFIGGFVVSVAATTFDKPSQQTAASMSMSDMVTNLKKKTGDNFDKEFITGMIAHHEGAVAMAKLSATNAKHDEIKQLSHDIVVAQEKEIVQMKQWRTDWGYSSDSSQTHNNH